MKSFLVILTVQLCCLLGCLALTINIDSRVPANSNGPGWIKSPSDVSVLPGQFAQLVCQNEMSNATALWLVNGRKNVMESQYRRKARVVQGKLGLSRLVFGPVHYNESGLTFSCEISTVFGPIPSRLATMTVLSPPSYSAYSHVGFIGQPFFLNFHFSGSPPTSSSWYKNGLPLAATPGRVSFDHTGVTFVSLKQHDSGEYRIRARNDAGFTTAVAYLKVIYWWANGSYTQHAAQRNPRLPLSVAVNIAISQEKHGVPLPTRHSSFRVSSADSTAHAERVLRKLNNRASQEAIRQGRSRVEIERILRRTTNLVGYPVHHLLDYDAARIIEATNCTLTARRYDCRDFFVLVYRTINGTCNNLFYPLNGAANVPFARMLPAEYTDGISRPVGQDQVDKFSGPWPSPRTISHTLMQDVAVENEHLTHMFMQWGQFLDHDMDLAPMFTEDDCGCSVTDRCLPIPVDPNDGIYGRNTSHNGRCLKLSRSIPACRCPEHDSEVPRSQINQLTSYIDASNVYGSTDELAARLRLFSGGLLKEGGRTHTFKGNLPFQNEKAEHSDLHFFEAGDERANEQVGLTIMHTIWMREHNRIARYLGRLNPCWGDNKLYYESRKIVGAMAQAITYNEFLPQLFGSQYRTFVPRYSYYNPFVDSTIPNEFATAAFRFGHSLIQPFLLRLDKDFRSVPEGPISLVDAFFNPNAYFKSNGTDPILRGLLVENARVIDEFISSVLTSKLFADGPTRIGADLASLNIQRGRDHGLAPYRKWERLCKVLFPGMNTSFYYKNTVQKLKDLYGPGGFRNGIDLWVGGLAEQKISGGQVGPTFACIMGLTFQRLRDGDRFWFEHPHIFTYKQRTQLRKTSLSKVICNNADNIRHVQRNAFRADQSRVSCSNLPNVDLRHWRDRRCIGHFDYR